MAEQQLPTPVEKGVLQWLVGGGRLAGVAADDLVPMYRRRGYKEEGARRAAGNVLGRLHRKGFMRRLDPTATFDITRSGKRAAQ